MSELSDLYKTNHTLLSLGEALPEKVEERIRLLEEQEFKEKGYSLSAGQYFDIKIDYIDITEEEFTACMDSYRQTLTEQFAESHRLEEEIMRQLDSLKFNANIQ